MDISTIVEELQSLKSKVDALSELYPKGYSVGAGVEQAKIQIPWICRTLDEASDALTNGRDPFGNPITSAQVVSGLKQLVAIVRDPSYGTLMDVVYPGIDKPLQECMDELERIIAQFALGYSQSEAVEFPSRFKQEKSVGKKTPRALIIIVIVVVLVLACVGCSIVAFMLNLGGV